MVVNTENRESNQGFYNNIKRCSCDICGKQDVAVVVHHQWGKPTLTECNRCNPKLFNAVSEAQKDLWLAGK